MAADTDKNIGETGLCRLCQVDDFRDVRQIIAGKGDDIRAPALDHPEIGAMVLRLQIDQRDGVTGLAHRLGDEFEAKRFEPQKNLCVHERARMDPEKPHRAFPLAVAAVI